MTRACIYTHRGRENENQQNCLSYNCNVVLVWDDAYSIWWVLVYSVQVPARDNTNTILSHSWNAYPLILCIASLVCFSPSQSTEVKGSHGGDDVTTAEDAVEEEEGSGEGPAIYDSVHHLRMRDDDSQELGGCMMESGWELFEAALDIVREFLASSQDRESKVLCLWLLLPSWYVWLCRWWISSCQMSCGL